MGHLPVFGNQSKKIIFFCLIIQIVGFSVFKPAGWCRESLREGSFHRAQALWREKKWDDAVIHFEAYLEKNPSGPYAARSHMALAMYLESFDRLREALDHYELGLETAKGRTAEELQTEIAAVHGRLGDYDEAIEIYQSLMRETPDWDIFKAANRGLKGVFRLNDKRRVSAERRNKCGEESLKIVLSTLGVVPRKEVLDKHLDREQDKGVSLASLRQTALAHGLSCQAVKAEDKNPRFVNPPAIFLFYPSHFVVFLGVNEKGVKIFDPFDPAQKETIISPRQLRQKWTGYALCFDKEFQGHHGLVLLKPTETAGVYGGDHPPHTGWAPPLGKTPHGFLDDPPNVWVNTSTLNLLIEDVDGVWSSRGPNIFLRRTYNSDDSRSGMFGNSWHFEYEVYLTETPGHNVTVYRSDGGWQVFDSYGDGTYGSREGYVHDKLEKKPDGTFTLLMKSGKLTYFFDATGKLTRIADRNDNAVSFGYDATNLPIQWGQSGSEDGEFVSPRGIAVDKDEYVYVADSGNSRIQKFDASGSFVAKWGSYGSQDGQFLNPSWVAADDTGHIYVSDSDNNCIQKFDSDGRFITRWGSEGSGYGQFSYPSGVAVDDSGHVYVADSGNYRIQKFDSDGNFIAAWGGWGYSNGYFLWPRGVAVDGNGNVYVTDSSKNSIEKFDGNGNFIATWGSLGRGDGEFNQPYGIAIDGQSYVYVVDNFNYRIQKFDSDGNFVSKWGRFGYGGIQFSDPQGAAVDSSGNIYVTDQWLSLWDTAINAVTKFKSNLPFGVFLSSITDPHGRSISFTYGSNGCVASVTDPAGRKSLFTYDANGNLSGFTDREGNTTQYTYDQYNYLNSITTGSGTIQIEYRYLSDLGLAYMPTTVTDPLNNERNYEYTGDVVVTDAKGMHTVYVTTEEQIFIAKIIVDPDLVWLPDVGQWAYVGGKEFNFAYDGYGNLTSITDPNTNAAQLTGDASGNMTTITGALGRTVSFSYDAHDNLTGATGPLGSKLKLTFDSNDNLTKITDPKGNVVNYSYDAYGQCTSFTDARGKKTLFTYDGYGNLASSKDPSGNTTNYTHDAAGRPTGLTDANGNASSYTYDKLDRLTQATYTDGSVTYSYDGSNLKRVTNKNGMTTTFFYDGADRLTKFIDENGNTIQYAYDNVGNLASITYPDGKAVTYTYDAEDRMTKVTDWLNNSTSYTYDPAGNLASISYPNGATTSLTYDKLDRLTAISTKKSDTTLIASHTYTYNALGNIAGATVQQPLAPVFSGRGVTTYTYNSDNQLMATNNTTYQYDDNGNLTEKTSGTTTTTFSYDPENRLTQFRSDGNLTSYAYDALGNRLEKTANSAVTGYINDINRLSPVVVAETDSSGTIVSYYVYGMGLVSKITSDGSAYYYHYDGLGSIVALTDGSQNLVNKYAYDPFGEVLKSTEGTPNPFRYAGRYGVMDEGNGMLYMRARYYDPAIGRFINKDPIGYFGGLNLYTYAANNPIRYTDINGLYPNREKTSKALGFFGQLFSASGAKGTGGVVGAAGSLYGATKPWTPFTHILSGAGATGGGILTTLVLGTLASTPAGWVIIAGGALAGGYLGGKLGNWIDRPFNNNSFKNAGNAIDRAVRDRNRLHK